MQVTGSLEKGIGPFLHFLEHEPQVPQRQDYP